MALLLSETRIVLVHPTLPDNVGAVARAMRHFGLRDLVIAEGGVDPRHPLAVRVAAGAEEILENALQVDTLEEALEGVVFAVGTTARSVSSIEMQPQEPRTLATLARDMAQAGAIALVFGTEKHGLSREQLRRCHQVAHIPGEEGTCLNLAMAVNIFAYEWRLADEALAHAHDVPLLASSDALDTLSDRLVEGLERAGILHAKDRSSKLHTLRRILSRTRLDPHEAALVRAIAEKLPAVLSPQASR
ncbi:tRNA (cytidine/uridine-2'-O-)-methyltransferase TrmJ [compost metagenome]